jgi:hypothetical protein
VEIAKFKQIDPTRAHALRAAMKPYKMLKKALSAVEHDENVKE